MNVKINNIVKSVVATTRKKSPEILTGLGIAGMITTTIMAVKATPKAISILSDKKEKKGEALTKKEIVTATWKCYIPSTLTASLSIFCIICSNTTNAKKNATLAAAYSITEAKLKNYQNKVIEKIGADKDEEIKTEIAQGKLNSIMQTNAKHIIETGHGDVLCMDIQSGRLFKSNMDFIKSAEATLNLRLRDEVYVSLNDFYDLLNLDNNRAGDALGWNSNDGDVIVYFRGALTKDGEPCLVLDYDVAPRYDYYK